MSVFSRSFLAILAVLGLGISSANAEIFYWQDDGSKASVVYPDTWRIVHNQKPDDVLTIMAPSDNAFPMCRLRVREDRRHVIYPQRYSKNIQHIDYSSDFWQDYVGEFRAANLGAVHDNAGLGKGFGSYADISFISDAGPKMQRRGVAFVSLYRDKAYIFECSAEASSYEQWHGSFMKIASSIDFRKEIYEFPGGNYRHFLADPVIRVHGPSREFLTHF